MDIDGSVEDPANLKINIIDFTLFDIGSGAYTEFVIEPEIIMGIYAKYPEYITKKYGCIHSHNNMSVFFSGTDTSTLLEQAFIHNYFVSLIINNNYDKIAKISYKGTRKVTETFYNRIKSIMLPYNRTVEEDVVCVIDCDVDYETTETYVDDELMNQIAVLARKEEEKKLERAKIPVTYGKNSYKRIGYHNDFYDSDDDFPVGKVLTPPMPKNQLDLFAEEKVERSNLTFEKKCEAFVKRLLVIDYTGDETKSISLAEAREMRIAFYSPESNLAYLQEATELCEDIIDEVFQKEVEANWFNNVQFQKLRGMISSNCILLLNVADPLERKLLEIIDFKLKELDDSRTEDFAVK